MQTGKNLIRTGRALTASVMLVPACDASRHETPGKTGTDPSTSPETRSEKAAQDRALRILKENANFQKGPPPIKENANFEKGLRGSGTGKADKDF